MRETIMNSGSVEPAIRYAEQISKEWQSIEEAALIGLLSDMLNIIEKSEYRNSEICKVTGLGFCKIQEDRESVIKRAKKILRR